MDKLNLVNTILATKVEQTQLFDNKRERISATILKAGPCVVTQIKNINRDGYNAIQIGLEIKKDKNTSKSIKGHIKKAGIKQIPRFLREVRVNNDVSKDDTLKVGSILNVADIFQEGDFVNVVGKSKGKGFTGVVKRHHFKGGPRTHGQSDRERAPGSIGQTTTPGRVYKGKRMAGRSGNSRITVKNLKVVKIDKENNRLIISGVVPGVGNSLLIVSKTV